jgi:hypothetical protein
MTKARSGYHSGRRQRVNTRPSSRRILDPSVHLAPLILGGLLITSFTAGAVLTSGLTTGRLAVLDGGGPGGASVTVMAPREAEWLTIEQRAIDFRLTEKGLPPQFELTTEQRAFDFRLTEKGLPPQFESR